MNCEFKNFIKFFILYILFRFFIITLRLISFLIFYYFFFFNTSIILEWSIIKIFSTKIVFLIYWDWITLLFNFTVLIISAIIFIYRTEYINSDKNFKQFFWLIILFVLSIIFIINRPNLISILLGWDGLGLISYCLIIFYQSKYSYNSGNLTIFTNRIGDITLILSISLIFKLRNWNFFNFLEINFKNLILLNFLILLTAFTKRAQIPFSSWLPVAIAAPTPVSSLVHSSTLVTAGIYLLIRFNKILLKNYYLLILIIRSLTILIARLCGLFEFDFKKIIAYSTLRQLGLILIIFSFKQINLSYFHLIIHAIFKSIIFINSGILIHNLLNYQDIRFLGNIKKFFPLTCIIFFISNLSLCGIPFLSGFFSKDKILEFILINNKNFFLFLFLFIRVLLTIIYRFRLNLFLIKINFNFLANNTPNDSKIINFSIIILFIFSIFLGHFLNWIIFYIENILIKPDFKIIINLTIIFSIFFIINIFKNIKFYKINFFFNKIWFSYYLIYLILKILNLGFLNYKFYDKLWREFLFKNSLISHFYNNNFLNLRQNNLINIFLTLNFLFLLLILI